MAVYTPLKSRTSANTAVGAVAGALPVLMGWSAVGASFSLAGGPVPSGLRLAALFLIVYLWQFPHFMAIAWIYRRDYGAAGLRMLTVVDPTGRRAGASHPQRLGISAGQPCARIALDQRIIFGRGNHAGGGLSQRFHRVLLAAR